MSKVSVFRYLVGNERLRLSILLFFLFLHKCSGKLKTLGITSFFNCLLPKWIMKSDSRKCFPQIRVFSVGIKSSLFVAIIHFFRNSGCLGNLTKFLYYAKSFVCIQHVITTCEMK